jgi:hypothetical protein
MSLRRPNAEDNNLSSVIDQHIDQRVREAEVSIRKEIAHRLGVLESELSLILSKAKDDISTTSFSGDSTLQQKSLTSQKSTPKKVATSAISSTSGSSSYTTPQTKSTQNKSAKRKRSKSVVLDKTGIFFDYDQIKENGDYRKLLLSGFVDITTPNQKKRGTLSFFHPSNNKVFFNILSNGVVRESQVVTGKIVIGRSIYSPSNKIVPGKAVRYHHIENKANRFRAMTAHLLGKIDQK